MNTATRYSGAFASLTALVFLTACGGGSSDRPAAATPVAAASEFAFDATPTDSALFTRVDRTGAPAVGTALLSRATNVTIGTDGAVSATISGQATPQTIGTLAIANFVNPAGLEPRGENLYAETAASGQPQGGTAGTNGLGTVMQGFLETSNVNVVQELVSMIQTQRAYEMNSKAIQTSDQMLQKLAQL